jgi:CheY-like chemotaxis protein
MRNMGLELVGTRVVVVDDAADSLEIMTLLLEMAGAEVAGARSAAEGLRLVTSFRPHVLVSDIGMPEEDGYSLVRRVRALPAAAGGGIPAIAVSAHVGLEDRAKARTAGFQVFLEKPVELHVFVACIQRLKRLSNEEERRRAERRQVESNAPVERRRFDRRQLLAC